MAEPSRKKSGLEPSWRLVRLPVVSPWASETARIVAVIIGLGIGGIAIKLTGLSPSELGLKVVRSTFGSSFGLQEVGILATPLILTGLAAAVAMQMRLWNIGAEGQLLLGAWAASGVGIFVQGPEPLMLLVLLLAGAVGGALWILLPALAKIYANVNEIITTLLLNFVAFLFAHYFAIGPWRDRKAAVISASYKIPYELPDWVGALHIGIFIAIALALIFAFIMRYTRWGYEVTFIGANREAAEYAGMRVSRRMLAVLLLSGAVAGIAGMIEVTGNVHRLQGGISSEYGYLGIIVAALVNGSPVGVIIGGLLMAVLLNAGIILAVQGISVSAVLALTGLILLFAAIGEAAAHYRLVRGVAEPVRPEAS